MLEGVVRRDRAVTVAGLIGLTVLAWGYVVRMAMSGGSAARAVAMPGMPGVAGTGVGSTPTLAWLIGMWMVMMVAMMLPSAAPTILLFDGVARRRRLEGIPSAPVGAFTLGYLAVWMAYAAVAGTAQWELHRRALLSPSMAASSPAFAAALLITAGIYQWLPTKGSCLAHCRSPFHVFTAGWREGTGGALVMGVRHGTFCVGCCGLLMALLFVAGVMNLVWVAVLAGFVFIERLLTRGEWAARLAGVGLVLWGVLILLA